MGWLFLAFVIVLPNYVLTQAAIAMDRERCYAAGAALAAVTNLVLNFLIVPDHGVRGAAAVVIATEAVLGGVLYFGLRRAWHPAVS
ncbi:polysaccharide biosynthesis C-terminal domain-containing protein [Paracidovorax avenae]|uniref:polysaccharide biosynthesis C-terminal domain-containing protein n=1 Tax=Paracidovorax avenae TaxID=80867 RepID=UPI001AD837BB|nr:polysaccharide biosynthesis C-terminal domain-containing protein [Paracidovorax avenae]